MLLSLLMVQTPMMQVMKLSNLVEHYFEHKNLDEDINVADYLVLHYLSDVEKGDHNRDMQLPFKHYSPSFLVFAFNPQSAFDIPIPAKEFPDSQKHITSYRSPFHTAEALSNIWQPPRLS